MISLLISVIICCLLIAFFYWIVTLLPIPQPFKNIVIALVALIIFLAFFAGGGHEWMGHRWRY